MDPFIRNDQYNFIKYQTQALINGYSTVNDLGVLQALRGLVHDKVMNLFEDLSPVQLKELESIVTIRDTDQAEDFLIGLKPFVIPFPALSDSTVKKLFPKVKKLKTPAWDEIELKDISYLGWNDYGQERKYIVAEYEGKLRGFKGTFKNSSKKGICTICNTFGSIGFYLSESKTSAHGNFVKKGNYICQDSDECNEKLKDKDKLDDFIQRINH
ncbi:FusB/FusC family EF-G-binding protein [Rossellomorea vietnamensis]|uniref:Ferrous iron transporter A n=1 Tax=Rossellomorea vietnamensis TaxID=218284 RepID=A0A0P6VVJ6_9BACI|nr:FusB/FusC family EF-G-binding protein [Rossellomorea vietnamensis]KPL58897.1 ferrous iron transporter A [Rossellomorea vietnamensis]